MKYLFLMLFISISSFIYAQNNITGRVVEELNGELAPIIGANVHWLNTSDGVVTDAEGNFDIEWNKAGKLVISFVGYQSDTLSVHRGDIVESVLVDGTTLEEVSISGRRHSTVLSTRDPVVAQVITGDELCKAACCNLGESFTTNAAVDVSYTDAVTGAKQIEMLGLTGRYVQMMTENMPNFRSISSLYGLSYIPGAWMESISISKGVGSVINGYEGIAGQISVDYKKPTTSEKLFINAFASDENMFELNVNTGILLNDKWSTALLVHGDRMNMAHDDNNDGFMDMPKQHNYNIFNRWQYKTDTWNIQFGGKVLEDVRKGGQTNHGGHTSNPDRLYTTEIENNRFEGFAKIGYLMPEKEHSSMALVINYTHHKQNALYGLRRYISKQNNLISNLIYQSAFNQNENQKFSAGVSFNYDFLDEQFYYYDNNRNNNMAIWNTEELVSGAFFQYTGHFWEKLTLMAGLRYDYHNIYGGFFTPRMHLSYDINDMTRVKLTGGSGARTPHIFADFGYMLASGNNIYINSTKPFYSNTPSIKTLDMERAWNYGVQFNRKFYLFGRLLNINLDYFHTQFTNQVVADNEFSSAGILRFYNLEGKSFSDCYQAEIQYELFNRFDITAAYRYNDAQTTYQTDFGLERKQLPLSPRYKALVNLSYATNLRKWQFDFTTQFNGSGRIPVPVPISNTPPEQPSSFDSYQIMNAQATKFFRQWSIYVGCENIADFKQKNPIIDAEDPWFSSYFDASKIWGPINGRKFYIGLRFSINR